MRRLITAAAAVAGLTLAAAAPSLVAPAAAHANTCTLVANQVSNGTSRLRLIVPQSGYVVDVAYYPNVQNWCGIDLGADTTWNLEAYMIAWQSNQNECLYHSNADAQEEIHTCDDTKAADIWEMAIPPGFPTWEPNVEWMHNLYAMNNYSYGFSCLNGNTAWHPATNGECSLSKPYINQINWTEN